MEPQSDDGGGAPLLPIPDWMKAKARGVSTQNVNWQKPAVYHNALRLSQSSLHLKPPAKLLPLVDNNQQHHESNPQSAVDGEGQSVPSFSSPGSIRKSVSCPPPTHPLQLARPATPPPPLGFPQHPSRPPSSPSSSLVPIPSSLPTFMHETPAIDTGRCTMTPPPRTPPTIARSDEDGAVEDNSRLMPLRQSASDFGKSNKWRARALANPFAKRKPANNERPPSTPPSDPPARPLVVKKSAFRMQQPPTNQEDEPAMEPVAPPPPRMATGKVQHSPKQQRQAPMQETQPDDTQGEEKQQPSPPSSPRWDPERAPKPKEKQQQQPKRPKGGKSTFSVAAMAEIQRKRDERRALQAQEKQRKDDELKEHGDDRGYKFRRLIKAFRDGLKNAKQDAAPPSTSSAKLSVFVRKRPLSKKELSHKGYDVITCTRRTQLFCHEPKFKVDTSESLENHLFSFDGSVTVRCPYVLTTSSVFDDQADNTAVYQQSVGPLIPHLLDHNGIVTVFAYGQTGSGKTYTMKSVYRQAASDLFAQLPSVMTSSSPLTVGVSFYDIYKNGVCDLLNGRRKVQALEDNDGVVQLVGVTEVTITNDTMLTELVDKGEAARITSVNGVHDDSSRSHAILRVTLYGKGGTEAHGRLSMVDLAGSERACETQTDDKSTRMEGAEINKSLLALKECIRAMDVGAKHLPFRQSKLTQILRDSFMCETSRTVMIATVSPCSEHSNHTLNTLRYADRLKEINGRDGGGDA
ncbi:Aste57867_2096 [Aphanomyces stellatus]|uniref:Kinesin-like protein n=1 Tax=Aphanomyces stellatus TaxID=120398 RepID=A0A485K6V5_9STRA|nr:hypothetical protein As57867_002091 [Aphanomyces stellatus]VFT79299.1 Aste57867_2096 [Aphanomyces stellatus]